MSQNVLTKILAQKREEVALLAQKSPLADLRAQAQDAPPARDFLAALRARPLSAVIAEIKRASPSAGSLAEAVDSAERAKLYEAGGAAALSVLTDAVFFSGSLRDLRLARAACSLPVLRKDFIIDLAQIYEARAAGADAVLLIVAALEPAQLADLYAGIREMGMTPLVEVHDQAELEIALGLNPELVGINNRNLKSFKIDLSTSLVLRQLIPAQVTVVAESGVGSAHDVAQLRQGGLDAFLVGTSLMRAQDPVSLLRSLVNGNGGRP